MSTRILGTLVAAAFVGGGANTVSAAALKPIDPAALQATVEGLAKELLLPGAMVLLRTPQGNFVVSYGTTELGATNPPRADTHFRAASNTKTMTAAVIVQLVQEGKLRFDDPISKYVQGVPNGDAITIRLLLKMRSGLYNYSFAPEIAESLDRTPARAWTPEELRALVLKYPPVAAPGAEFEYCNTNYVLLGLVVEKIIGQPLARIMQDRLFGPTGMSNTLLASGTSDAMPEPYSHGYIYGGSSYALVDDPYPADLQAAARAGTLKPKDVTRQNPSYAFGTGTAISTANDLAAWISALVGGKIFNADYQRQWLDSPEPEDPKNPKGQQYGYGIALIAFGPNKIYFHGGEMPGYNSFMGHDPDNDVTLVIWTNLAVSLDGKLPANAMMIKMLELIYTDSPVQ